MPTQEEQLEGLLELERLDALRPDEKKALDTLRGQPNILPQIEVNQQGQQEQLDQLQSQKDIFQSLVEPELPPTTIGGRSFTSLGTEMGLEIVGSIAGTVAGSKAGKPVQGSSVGTGIGQSIFQLLQEGAPKLGVPEDVFGPPPETNLGALGKIGASAGADLGFGAAATTLKRGFSKLNPLSSLSPDDVKLLEFLEKNIGSDIPPSLIAPESRSLALMENLAGGSFLAAGTFKAQRINITEVIQNGLAAQARFITKGRSREQISKTVTKILKNKTAAMNKSLEDIATRIDLLGVGAVRVNNPVKFLREEFENLPTGLKARKELKTLNNFLGPDGEKITKVFGNDTITFKRAQQIVNDLNDDIVLLSNKRGKSLFGVDNASKLQGKLTSLRKKMVDTMARRIKGAGDPELSKAFRTLETIKFQGHIRYNEKLIKDIMQSSDTAVSVILNKIKSPGEMRRLKFLIGKDWRRVEGIAMQDILETGTTRIGGKRIVSGDGILNALDNFDPNMKGIVFNPASRKKFEEFATALARVQADLATNIGTVFIELSQAGAVTSMLFGGASPANLTILFGPAMLEKMFSTPAIVKAMIRATRQGGAASKVLSNPAAAISGILGILSKHGIDYIIDDSPDTRFGDEIGRQKEIFKDTPGLDLFAD